MKKRFLIGLTCALASTLSMGLLAACGGEEGQKPPEKLEMNPSLVLEGKDITFSETLNATLNDLNASLEITVTKPDETQTKVNAGDSFAFDSIGYYTVTFVATRGEGEAQERVEKKITGYIGAEGERISFESVTSGAAFAANTDYHASHELNEEAQYIKYGKYSLKGEFTEEGVNGDNYLVVAFANPISAGTFNQSNLFIHASEDCVVQLSVQEGEGWTWIGDSRTQLSEGWNQVSVDFDKDVSSAVTAFRCINYSATNPTLYFDAIGFANDWQIRAVAEADFSVNVGGTVSLSDFYTLVKGEGVVVTATAQKGTVNGLQYTAPNQGGQIDEITLTAEKDGVEKELKITLQTKGAAKIAEWNMTEEEGFTVDKWPTTVSTGFVDFAGATDGKAYKIELTENSDGGWSGFKGAESHTANGATSVKLRIYAEKACTVTVNLEEYGGDPWNLLSDGEHNYAVLQLKEGWHVYTLSFTRAMTYRLNQIIFKQPEKTDTVFYLDMVTFLRGESLFTDANAANETEVNEVFKPVVTVQEGATYTLEIVTAPNGSSKPTVSENGFAPNALGDYTYKITVSKTGYESEEYIYSVTVIDTTKPVIAGTPVTVPTKFVGESITFADLITGLTVTDNYDTEGLTLTLKELKKGETSVTVEPNAAQFTFAQSGNYTAVFAVKDSSNNETTVGIPVKVERGIDFGNVDAVEIFVGDDLVIPAYTIPDTAGLTVTFYLDNSEITVGADRNAGVQNTVGNYTLKAELKKADGSKIAEQTLSVKVKDITVTQNTQFVGKDITYSEVLTGTADDPKATVEIKVTKPDGTEVTADSNAFEFTAPGYYTVTFTAKKGEYTSDPVEVEGYVRDKGEVLSFESAASGAAFGTTSNYRASNELNTDVNFVKYGKQSLKATYAADGINGDNYLVIPFSASINAGRFNQISLWIHASEACEVALSIQNGDWAWAVGSKTQLQAGWNQVSVGLDKDVSSAVTAFRCINYSATNPTLYFDAIGFAYDWQIRAVAEADFSVNVGGTVSLSDFYTLVKGEGVVVTATAQKGTVNGLQYTAPNQGGQIDEITLTAEKDGVEKELKITLQTKGAAKIAEWNMTEEEGFTVDKWPTTVSTGFVDFAGATDGKAYKIELTENSDGGWSGFKGAESHTANGATSVKLRIYAEKACTVTVNLEEYGGDPWNLLSDGEHNYAVLQLKEGWHVYTLSFTRAMTYRLNQIIFKQPEKTDTVFYLDMVTFLRGESLFTDANAANETEVNEVFKPVVTVQEGATYTLEIVTAPNGSSKPTVSENGFAPNALGDYTYKITVSKTGYESEEYIYSVTVIDTTKPVIAGTPVTVPTKFVGESITFADLITGLTVTDNYDTEGLTLTLKELKKGETSVTVEPNAAQFTFAQSGNYTAVFAVKDSSNNETTVGIPVKVERGIDFGNVDAVEIFVGDDLVIPAYTIPDTAGLTVTFYLDNSEITVGADRNAGVQNTVGNYTLKAELKKADGSKIAEQTLSVKVKDITVTQNTQFVGKDITYSEVLTGTADDPKATVEIKVTKPDGTEVTADSNAFEFTAPGYYTVTFTAKKGEYTSDPVEVEGYVRDAGEAISFEGVTGSDYLNTNSDTHGINTDLTYVKFGKQSLKATIAANGESWVSSLKATLKVGKANQVTMWIYANKACTIGVGVQNGGTWTTSAKMEKTLAQGWNQITVAFETAIQETESFAAFLIANKSEEEVTLYLDDISFAYEWQILEKADAAKEVDANGTLDLTTLYTLIEGEGVEVTATAEAGKGTVNGMQFTAPAEGGSTVTVTLTAIKNGETKTLALQVYIKGTETILKTFDMGTNNDEINWSAWMGGVLVSSPIEEEKDGATTWKFDLTGNDAWANITPKEASACSGATFIKLRIYAEQVTSVKFNFGANGWAIAPVGGSGQTISLEAGWNDVVVEFSGPQTFTSFDQIQLAHAEGSASVFWLDSFSFGKK